MTSVVQLRGVTKVFDDVVALSEVSFELAPGMTALLGPNGAGKSTIIRVITGQTIATDGEVSVFGGPPRGDPERMGRIGLVPQQENLFGRLSAKQFVQSMAAMHRVADPSRAADEAIARVGLTDVADRQLRTYSKGMRQRVKVAQALVHDPPLLVLDEPLNGLDPRQRALMIELLRGYADVGRTVLVSSHVLDEVERFGSRILLMGNGRLVAEGDFHDIRDLLDDRPRRIRVRTSQPRALAAAMVKAGIASGISITSSDTIEVNTSDALAFRAQIAGVARSAKARLLEVRPLDEDLESVFRYLVGGRR
ncbi:MAG: ABC-2 type transport system ATP-binding protein [Glaciecola sp.]|jgi:ABC-2 type transport system ATP-binding protein